MACLISIVLTAVSGVFSTCDPDWFPSTDIACDVNHGKYHGVATAAIVFIVLLAALNIYTVVFICSNQARFGVSTAQGNWRITNRRQLQLQNQMLMMQNQMLAQQMEASQGQNFGTYTPTSGPKQNVGTYTPTTGPNQNFQGFQMEPMGPNAPYPTAPNPVYPMGTNTGFATGGYPMGQTVPPTHPDSDNAASDTKMDYNSQTGPTAPPPSYDEVTQNSYEKN